jgi:hypothetical protein
MFGKKHLVETKESYWTHFKFAFKYGFILLYAALLSFIHGIFPGLFKFRSAKIVINVYNIIQKRNKPGESER